MNNNERFVIDLAEERRHTDLMMQEALEKSEEELEKRLEERKRKKQQRLQELWEQIDEQARRKEEEEEEAEVARQLHEAFEGLLQGRVEERVRILWRENGIEDRIQDLCRRLAKLEEAEANRMIAGFDFELETLGVHIPAPLQRPGLAAETAEAWTLWWAQEQQHVPNFGQDILVPVFNRPMAEEYIPAAQFVPSNPSNLWTGPPVFGL